METKGSPQCSKHTTSGPVLNHINLVHNILMYLSFYIIHPIMPRFQKRYFHLLSLNKILHAFPMSCKYVISTHSARLIRINLNRIFEERWKLRRIRDIEFSRLPITLTLPGSNVLLSIQSSNSDLSLEINRHTYTYPQLGSYFYPFYSRNNGVLYNSFLTTVCKQRPLIQINYITV